MHLRLNIEIRGGMGGHEAPIGHCGFKNSGNRSEATLLNMFRVSQPASLKLVVLCVSSLVALVVSE